MDPCYSVFGGYIVQPCLIYTAPPVAVAQPTQESPFLPNQANAYTHKWNKCAIKRLYTTATEYSVAANKDLSSLNLQDFELICATLQFSPKEALEKFKIAWASKSYRPGAWNSEEEELLRNSVNRGLGWSEIASEINQNIYGGHRIRLGKHCKEKWHNQLNPQFKKGHWTPAEDLLLLESYRELGGKWKMISDRLETRTEHHVKNRVRSLLTRQQQSLRTFSNEQESVEEMICGLRGV